MFIYVAYEWNNMNYKNESKYNMFTLNFVAS